MDLTNSIYDTAPNEFFKKKSEDFKGLMHYASSRYEIPGVLLREDLYQEALIALNETFEYHWSDHPDSDEFSRSFKSRLFHRMSNHLRYHKAKQRDWRKEFHEFANSDESDETIVSSIPQSTFLSPEFTLELRDLNRYVSELESELEKSSITAATSSSCSDALTVLRFLLDPDMDSRDYVDETYERVPSTLSNSLLSKITGWDIMKVRRAISRMRSHALTLAEKFDINVTRR